MAFDFPITPNVGDLFQDSSSGAVYQWNGYAWIGGVTGIGLQTVKETRYLVPGSFTFTRDPKSNGFADIWLTGGCGGCQGWTGGAGFYFASGSGGSGALTIKWRYPLAPTCPVVVGAGYIAGVTSAGTAATPSSFDTVLTADTGKSGIAASTNSITIVTVGNAGAPGIAGNTGDENYNGMSGVVTWTTNGGIVSGIGGSTILRDVVRRGAPGKGGSGAPNVNGTNGEPGAVIVREYINP
jgi:hypothetical protein